MKYFYIPPSCSVRYKVCFRKLNTLKTNMRTKAVQHSPSRFPSIAFMFFKTAFAIGNRWKSPPRKLDIAFLRWYLCSDKKVNTHKKHLLS